MKVVFWNYSRVVQFVRDDEEQFNWTQEEMTVNATYPYDPEKIITRGMQIVFSDPATGEKQVYEIRNVTTIEPEHYQQIIAENLAISELSDEHIGGGTEITNKTAAQALTTVLSGTLWSVGENTASGTQSVDIARGTVWQAVASIAQNWNVYITPRITFSATGLVNHRYLDISPAVGTWRGVRLSIDKNMNDSTVTVDDSEVLTALYGYGGQVEKAQASGDDKTEELTFADVVWTATEEHPAKPAGQTYLEDPAATALYGRNGRPRYGFYQNGDITDANLLLQKTWETLQTTNKPKISISGTVADLYRLGYADQPIRLHDIALVDIPETGETFELQIIKLDLDLVDPTATQVEIGAYIPNIVYINRDANESPGGGGGRGQDPEEYEEANTYSAIERTNTKIGMVVGTRNGDNYIKAGEISIAINESTGETMAKINADRIFLDGATTIKSLLTGAAEAASFKTKLLDASVGFNYQNQAVTWRSYTARFCNLSDSRYFLYAQSAGSTTPYSSQYGEVVTTTTDTTIHYLGGENT